MRNENLFIIITGIIIINIGIYKVKVNKRNKLLKPI